MKIAVLGTGLMGKPIAERLRSAGHSVAVYNRTQHKAEGLRDQGIAVAERPEEAIQTAEVVLLLLADAAAIRDVLLGETARKLLAGRSVVQMGTIGPRESCALGDEISDAGGEYLEAPALGSIAEVRAGTLYVLVGGTEDQYARRLDLFRCLSQAPRLVGPVGKAAALKLALNQLIAAETAAFSLSLGLVQREGVPVDTFMDVLRQSALYAPTFEKKLPRLLGRDFTNPNFSTRHLLKDVDLFLEEATDLGLDAGSLAGVRPLLEKTIAQGLGEADYSALYMAVDPSA